MIIKELIKLIFLILFKYSFILYYYNNQNCNIINANTIKLELL